VIRCSDLVLPTGHLRQPLLDSEDFKQRIVEGLTVLPQHADGQRELGVANRLAALDHDVSASCLQ